MLALIDADAVLDSSQNVFNPDVYRGHAGFQRWVETVGAVWDDLGPSSIEFLGEVGEHVVAAVRVSGRGRRSGAQVEMASS